MVLNAGAAAVSLLVLVAVPFGLVEQASARQPRLGNRIARLTPADSPHQHWNTVVAQSASERYRQGSEQLVEDLRQLHPDIVDARSSASILNDYNDFLKWGGAVTVRAGLSLEQQQAIALTVTDFIVAFQYEQEGALFPTDPNYEAYGGYLFSVEHSEETVPRVTGVSYRILSRDPVAVEVSVNVRSADSTDSVVVGRVEAGQFVAIAPGQSDPAAEASRLADEGKTELEAGNLQAAHQALEAARQIYRDLPDNEGEFWVLDQLLRVYDRLGDESNYQTALQRQADLAQSMQDPLLLRRVGSGFQCGNYWDAAIATYQNAQDIYTRNRPDQFSLPDAFTVEQELLTLVSMAQTLIKADRLPEAETVLQEAITLLNAVFETPLDSLGEDDVELDRQIRNFSEFFNTPLSSSNLYLMMQWVLVAQGKTDEALVAIEQGRTQALEELWAVKQPGTRIPAPSLAEIQAIARRRDATLITYSFNWLIDACGGDTVAPELLTWTIEPTGDIHFHAQPIELSTLAYEPDDVRNLVQDTRTVLGARGLTVIAAALEDQTSGQERPYLRSLHDLLIDPIAELLSTNPNDRIIFVPDFVLFMVPFPALQADDGSYLVEQHTILTSPSIQVLALTEQSRQRSLAARSNPLVVGNPTYTEVQLGPQETLIPTPLPGAEQEAIAIADLLNTQPLIGDQATKGAILQRFGDASLLHLATHGFLEGITLSDLPGAIAVAQSGEGLTPYIEIPGTNTAIALSDNGLISTRDILSFRLQAELVVLSACNTGGGELTGDGVTGLSRAFIAAGVPSIIVSLWSVPDAPTGELMEVFYQEWLDHGDKAQALRAAMLATLEKYPDPVNWAAFTLIGEAD
ncbi:MAG: CHAT domain-containing protein [Cyanobacteria bacterium J06635_15]